MSTCQLAARCPDICVFCSLPPHASIIIIIINNNIDMVSHICLYQHVVIHLTFLFHSHYQLGITTRLDAVEWGHTASS